jgi:hypothetical protein
MYDAISHEFNVIHFDSKLFFVEMFHHKSYTVDYFR